MRTFPTLLNFTNSHHCTATHILCDEAHLESSKMRERGMDSSGSGHGAMMMGFVENGNESLCCTKGREILWLLNDYQRLKQDSVL
jgi:hypothetical protein